MTTDMPMFLGSSDFRVEAAGGKAATLHELVACGFDVPPGFVIPADTVLEQVQDAELAQWVDALGGFPVAVRSSGVFEDLDDASFAGQYESYLDVADTACLRTRITDCRNSVDSERVRAYLSDRGLDPRRAAVAVLVQSLVDARTAGVGFTIDPISGIEEHGLIECCRGLGEPLVSGRVTPTRLTIRLDDGSVVERTDGSEAVELGLTEAAELARLMLRVQAFRHRPQDIEWAIDTAGKLWLLQSRAITTIIWRTDIEQFSDADLRDGGVSARVCTPLMFSLYNNAFQPSMQRFWGSLKLLEVSEVRNWMAMYYGRPYWNVSGVKQCYRKIPGYNERVFDDGLGVMANYGDTGPRHTPINPSTIARALPTALALERTVRKQLGEVERFAAAWPAKYRAWRNRAAQLAQTDDHDFMIDLVDCLLTFHANTERTYFATIYHNSSVQSDFTTLLDKIDSATHGNTSVVHLIGGLAEVSHMAMQDGIVNLHRVAVRDGIAGDDWQDALADFLDEHGFHADAELDLTCPRWSEEPDRVRTMVESMLANDNPPADPAASLANQRKRFETELASVRQRVRSNPLTRLRFERPLDKHVSRARSYLVARERMREFSSQAYAIVRAYVVEAGLRLARDGRLSDPRDVFMLSIHELADLAQSRHGSGTLTRSIAFRRAMYEGYRDVTPPHELGGDTVAAPPVSGGLAGLGCSPGVAEGTARVIASLSDIGELRAGDILVTRFTDPGWTPALGLIAGVVTEVGGMLSHAAVIGREYGIPAVLNVTGATEAIQSGQRIRVNGSTGEISRLEIQSPVPIAIAQCSATPSDVVGRRCSSEEMKLTAPKRLICIAGGDGSGKTTQIARLSAALQAQGHAIAPVTIWDAFLDTSVASKLPFRSADIYGYLKLLSPVSRAHFLFHALHLALELAGRRDADTVLLNAYWYKYFATEVAHGGEPSVLRQLAAGFPEPDLTFYLTISPPDALARKRQRSDYESGYGDADEFLAFQERSQATIDTLADEFAWIRLDGATAPTDLTTAMLERIGEDS